MVNRRMFRPGFADVKEQAPPDRNTTTTMVPHRAEARSA